jgi:hypothetical protein
MVAVFVELCKILGVTSTTTTLYYPSQMARCREQFKQANINEVFL